MANKSHLVRRRTPGIISTYRSHRDECRRLKARASLARTEGVKGSGQEATTTTQPMATEKCILNRSIKLQRRCHMLQRKLMEAETVDLARRVVLSTLVKKMKTELHGEFGNAARSESKVRMRSLDSASIRHF